MVVRGRVQNGVVVLDGDIRLPEGEEVTVIGSGMVSAASSSPGPPPHSVLDIPAVSLGAVLQTPSDDVLGEMLDSRP